MFVISILLVFVLHVGAAHAELPPRIKAQVAATKMLALKDNLGLTHQELYEIALYIETTLKRLPRDVHHYLRKKHTGLSRTIEYFPEREQVFIHLKTHGIDAIGKGSAKWVTCSIKYDLKSPELVANSIIKEHTDKKNSALYEWNTIKILNGCPGISYTYEISSHAKRKSTKTVTEILQRLYQGGTFSKYFRKRVSLDTMIKLFHDVAVGMKNMHSRDLVHGDLHLSNLMIDNHLDPVSGEKILSGVIIDFNHTLDVLQAKKLAPRLQAPRRNNPPECYLVPKEELDPKAVDVYAMGLCLYRVYFREEPVWTLDKTRFLDIVEMGDEERLQFGKALQNEIEAQLTVRQEDLGEYPEFARFILRMCDVDPYKRPNADEICTTLAALRV